MEKTDPIFVKDSDVRKIRSISIPRIKGDGSQVLMQFQFEDGQDLKAIMPTEHLLELINHLANMHTAAQIESKFNKSDKVEFIDPPETHTSRSGYLIYTGDADPVVGLRIQTEEDRQLLIVFDTGDFQRICQIVRTADTPQEFDGAIG